MTVAAFSKTVTWYPGPNGRGRPEVELLGTGEQTFMSDQRAASFNGLLVAAIFSVAAFVLYQTGRGGQVAIHWGPDNRPDSWVGSSAIHLINPIIALLIWFVASFFHQGFATKRLLTKPGRTRLSNFLLLQLVAQLLMALFLNGS